MSHSDDSSCNNLKTCNDCYRKDSKDDYQKRAKCPSKCCYDLVEGYEPEDILCRYKSAVVKVTSEFQFTTSVNPDDKPFATADSPSVDAALTYGNNLHTVHTYGNGFFITKKLIVVPASLVMAPPDYTLAYNRYPFTENTIDPDNLQSDARTVATSIYVDVKSVNGEAHDATYKARLYALYGAGNFALLCIDHDSDCNRGLPCIMKCHPEFKFGDSRKHRAGNKVYLIGDAYTRPGYRVNMRDSILQSTGTMFVQGHISDHRGIDKMGLAQEELLITDVNTYAYSCGLPIINQYGCVIGMQTMCTVGATHAMNTSANITTNPFAFNQANGEGMVAGPSSYFLANILESFLNCKSKGYQNFVSAVSDPSGDYLNFTPSYLGLAWEAFDGSGYFSYRDAATGELRTSFPAVEGEDCEKCITREVTGLRVAGLSGDASGATADRFRADIYLPGTSAPGSGASTPWVDSPLRASGVELNDIILRAEEVRLGSGNKSVPLSFFTSIMTPGETISLDVAKHSSGYETKEVVKVQLSSMPLFYNYPHYKYGSFPYASLPAYGQFFAHPAPVSPDATTNPLPPLNEQPIVTLPTV